MDDTPAAMREWWWCALWALLSAAWCVSASTQLSATFDEPLYIARGLERWRSASLEGVLRLGTMPLPVDVQTLPLALAERWRGVPFDARRDLDQLLPWARAMNLGFWFMLLAYAQRIGASCGGIWGGRLAVALLACEPSVLAHAGLATTDIALTACLLALCHHFRANRDGGWLRRCGISAVWYALAVLAKASGLVLGPVCLIVIELERRRALSRAAFADLAWITVGGLALVFAYCGSDWRPQASFVEWARALPADAYLSPTMVWLADHLRIFPNAGDGIVRQIRHNVRGHGSYLLGVEHARALWWYFPVLLTIKLSESTLLLPLLALRQARALINWPMLCAGTLIAWSLTFRVQLGIRMVLPLVALWIIGTAVALGRSVEEARAGRRMVGRVDGWMSVWRDSSASFTHLVIALAVLWSAFSAIRVWPEALTYVNRFWGGTAEGYHLVSDSNYDWGQGIKDLRAWLGARGGERIALWYFGSDPAAERAPFRLVALHALPTGSSAEIAALAAGDLLAAGTTLVYGTSLSPSHARAAAWLRARRPVARTPTFLIYELGGSASAPNR